MGFLFVGMASLVGARTYTKMAGFAVDAPDGWTAGGDKAALKLNSTDGASVDFWLEDTPSPLAEFAAGYIKNYQQGLSQARLGPIRSCKVNGLKIVRAEGVAVSNSIPIHFTVGVYANGPHLLKFSAVCRSDRYAAQKADLSNILGSVKAR